MKAKLYTLLATACVSVGTFFGRASLYWIAKAKREPMEASPRHPLLAPKFLFGLGLSGLAGGLSGNHGILPAIGTLLGMLAMMTLIPKDQ